MFLKILCFLIVLYLFVRCFIFLKFELPMFRFKVYYHGITSAYKKFADALEKNESYEEPVHYEYSCLIYKYELNFLNTSELASQLEQLIDEALDCYDKLGTILKSLDSLKRNADDLRKLRLEIRMKQWHAQ